MDNVIAIDGPAASGKSTVAKRVAKKTNGLYVDSGALYRAITWKALQEGVDTTDFPANEKLAQSIKPEFYVKDNAVCFRIDGKELNAELRTPEINHHVSFIAATPGARDVVVSWLRKMPTLGNLVMEGRDIGTAVFPNATKKFYLDASPEERARRRYAEQKNSEKKQSVTEVDSSLKRRDKIDSSRKKDPLKIADDATIIDSTGKSIEDVVDIICK
jgi:cytidylate kinase